MCAAVGCNNYVGTTTGLSFFRLTERHITLPAFSSMKVSLAAQVRSHSVAEGITTLCMISDKLDSEAIHTAKFLEQFNKLFDVFNSRTMAGPNNFSRGITAGVSHSQRMFAMVGDCHPPRKIWSATMLGRVEDVYQQFITIVGVFGK